MKRRIKNPYDGSIVDLAIADDIRDHFDYVNSTDESGAIEGVSPMSTEQIVACIRDECELKGCPMCVVLDGIQTIQERP